MTTICSTFSLQILRRKDREPSKLWERGGGGQLTVHPYNTHYQSTLDGRRKGQTSGNRDTSPLLSETVKASRLSPKGASSGGDGCMAGAIKDPTVAR